MLPSGNERTWEPGIIAGCGPGAATQDTSDAQQLLQLQENRSSDELGLGLVLVVCGREFRTERGSLINKSIVCLLGENQDIG